MSSAVARVLLLPGVLVALVATLGVPGLGPLMAPRLAVGEQRSAVTDAAPSSSVGERDAGQDPIATPLTTLAPPDISRFVAAPASDVTPALPARNRRGALFTSLAASFITLQALDVHSTLLAIDRGAGEVNPMMAPFASRPAALIAVKAGAAGGILFMIDRIHTRNRLAGVVMMAAANSAYATVVANNYRLAHRARR